MICNAYLPLSNCLNLHRIDVSLRTPREAILKLSLSLIKTIKILLQNCQGKPKEITQNAYINNESDDEIQREDEEGGRGDEREE